MLRISKWSKLYKSLLDSLSVENLNVNRYHSIRQVIYVQPLWDKSPATNVSTSFDRAINAQLILMFFLFLFQDQFANVAAHTLKGIDFLDKYGNFVKDRCAIEIEYATKLRYESISIHRESSKVD